MELGQQVESGFSLLSDSRGSVRGVSSLDNTSVLSTLKRRLPSLSLLRQRVKSPGDGNPNPLPRTPASLAGGQTLTVWVEPPDVSGDTVVYRWRQSGHNAFQRANTFSFRYEGIDLSAFSPLLLYEVFLGLQLKVFAAYRAPVEVIFPQPLPKTSVAYWRAFHGADLVSIGPVSSASSYDPWTPGNTAPANGRPYGVFFGDGKDSTLAACMLSELYGPESVELIQFVGPLRPDPELKDRLTRRQESLMLQPAREHLGVATQRVWTDYQAQFVPDGYHARPHLELYTVGALPILLSHGASLCTFSIPRMAYAIRKKPNGETWFSYAKSRPEMLATQSAHYQRALGANLTVTNLNFFLMELPTFRILVERYPESLKQIVMCTQGDVEQRWCYNCRKCSLYVHLGLCCEFVDPRFDYDRFFTQSKYVKQIVEHARSDVELSMLGNAPWVPFVSSGHQYLTVCHLIHTSDEALIADRLSPDGLGNLLIMKAMFGNRAFPSVELLATQALEMLGHDTARQVARIAAEYGEFAHQIPGPTLIGNEPAEYDFSVRMPTRTESLDNPR